MLLDSLDEAKDNSVLLDVGDLARGGGDPEAFRVWVTCRDQFWARSPDVQSEFASIWDGVEWNDAPAPWPPEGEVRGVRGLHLSTLSDADLLVAARAERVDEPDRFVEAVRQNRAGGVARTPDTLAEVIAIYQDTNEVPRSKTVVYARLVRRLAAEPRRQDRLKLSTDERLAIAGRVAGVMTFCERVSIVAGDAGEGDVEVSDLVGGEEPLGNRPGRVSMNTAGLRETIDTALFGGLRRGAVEFTRAPVRESLAVDWLGVHDVPLAQVQSLVMVEGRVRPGLEEVAAWCASVRPELFGVLLGGDPGVLARADLDIMEPEHRVALFEVLMDGQASDALALTVVPSGMRVEEIGDDLKEWLKDGERAEAGRDFALSVIRASGMVELADACVGVALDGTAPMALRQRAVRTAGELWERGAEELDALMPLVRGEAGADPHHDLWGLAVDALMPERLQADEAIMWCPLPNQYRPSDPFSEVLLGQVIPNLSAAGVRHASRLVEALEDPEVSRVADLVGSAVVVRQLDLGLLKDVVADVPKMVYRQKQHVGEGARPVLERWTSDISLRRAVIGTLVTRGEAEALSVLAWGEGSPRDLIPEADHAWLVKRYDVASGDSRAQWARLVSGRVAPEDFLRLHGGVPGADDPIRAQYHKLVGRRDDGTWVMEDQLNPRDPTGEVAAMKQAQKERIEAEHRKREERADRSRKEHRGRIHALLVPGQDAWDALGEAVSGVSEGQPVQRQEWWGWLESSEQDDLVRVAEAHLEQLHSHRLGNQAARRVARSALYTVVEARGVDAAPGGVWEALASVLVLEGPPDTSVDGHGEEHNALVAKAYAQARGAVLDAVRDGLVAEFEETRFGRTVLRNLDPVYDEAIGRLACDVAEMHPPPSGALHDLLVFLFEHGDPGAYPLARKAFEGTGDPETPARRRMAAAARAMIARAPGGAWDIVGPMFVADPEMLDDVLTAMTLDLHAEGAFSGLSSEGLAALYRLIADRHPYVRPDRPTGLPFRPGKADRIEAVKNGLLVALRKRGEAESLGAYTALAEKVPGVRYALRQAELAWMTVPLPPSPARLVTLVADGSARLIRSDADLYAAVLEAARAFGSWLQDGPQPGVYTLWNAVRREQALAFVEGIARRDLENPAEVIEALSALEERPKASRKGRSDAMLYVPRDEAELSDALARFLRTWLRTAGVEGVTVAREAELKRGHVPDLTVSAYTVDHDGQRRDLVEIGVEVKPSWSDGFVPALRSQLAEGYLDGAVRRYGVYVAAVYGPDRWFEVEPGVPDWKKRAASRYTVESAQTALGTEVELTSPGERRKTVGVAVVDATLPPRSAT